MTAQQSFAEHPDWEVLSDAQRAGINRFWNDVIETVLIENEQLKRERDDALLEAQTCRDRARELEGARDV